MDRLVIFCVGAAASAVSEIFWNGEARWSISLWGGTGMLLLRRIVLRFPFANKALLCFLGAFPMIALWFIILMVSNLEDHAVSLREVAPKQVLPSFSYCLYRFFLIAPAFTIIEYLESCFIALSE